MGLNWQNASDVLPDKGVYLWSSVAVIAMVVYYEDDTTYGHELLRYSHKTGKWVDQQWCEFNHKVVEWAYIE